MTNRWQNQLDRLLKAMSEGEKPTDRREREWPAVAKQRADREDKRRSA